MEQVFTVCPAVQNVRCRNTVLLGSASYRKLPVHSLDWDLTERFGWFDRWTVGSNQLYIYERYSNSRLVQLSKWNSVKATVYCSSFRLVFDCCQARYCCILGLSKEAIIASSVCRPRVWDKTKKVCDRLLCRSTILSPFTCLIEFYAKFLKLPTLCFYILGLIFGFISIFSPEHIQWVEFLRCYFNFYKRAKTWTCWRACTRFPWFRAAIVLKIMAVILRII